MPIDLPPQLILPERPAFIMPSPARIRSEEWWKANLPGMAPGLGFLARGAASVQISLQATAVNTAETSSYAFTGLDFGAEDTNRWILAAFSVSRGNQDAFTVSSAPIAGTNGTDVKTQAHQAGSTSVLTSMYIRNVPTGTTGQTITVNINTTSNQCRLTVYRLIMPGGTPDSTFGSTGDNPSGTLNCPAGGVIIGSVAARAAATLTDWSATLDTEDDDGRTESQLLHSAAHELFAAEQTAYTVQALLDVTPASAALAVASFGP